jgi:hypothetical protein
MTTLQEAGSIHAEHVTGHRYRARLIEGDRWGSSGYYGREVLERDGPNVWPAGTQVFMDHPGITEQQDRPERSVRDLAGKITSTPIYEADGLYADVEFYPHVAPVIEALWDDVGMSIRASGTAESGERDGRTGPVITSLSEGVSVDVVTRAGAGGKLVQMLESARREVAEALPGDLTAADLERRLEDTIGPGGMVHDYTDEWVVWNEYTDGEQMLWQQTYTADENGRVTLTGTPARVDRRVTYDAHEPPADLVGTTESRKEPTVAQIQIDEADHKRLTERAGQVDTLEAERDHLIEERDAAQAALTEAHQAADKASMDAVVAGAGVEFTALEAKGLRVDVPMTESGRVDLDAFAKTVTEAAAEKRANSGEGQPTGVGITESSKDLTDDELDTQLANL